MNDLHAQPYDGPILDSHIHLFDPHRPQGIPWPVPGDAIYAPYLPADYAPIADRHRIEGAVVVEASPWPADNHWMLDLIADQPLMLGMIGNLDLTATDFAAELDRLAVHPKFLGLRYGNLWDRDLKADLRRPGVFEHLRHLAALGLTLDSANPDLRLLEALCEIAEAVPTLRLVLDHLPNAAIQPGEHAAFARRLEALAAAPQVMVKLSEIPQPRAPLEAGLYQARIDELWGLFGEDRCLFGSDWPNSENLASYEHTLGLVKALLARYPREAQEKFFLLNARRAYGLC